MVHKRDDKDLKQRSYKRRVHNWQELIGSKTAEVDGNGG